MQLADRIEARRFVGREFLLWLWVESELFEGTLSTEGHEGIGLWLERTLVLSANKDSTKITAPTPGRGREAKEALLIGQLPESAGVRIAWGDDETSFVLKADRMCVSGLKLKTVLDKEEPNVLLEELMPQVKKKKKRSSAEEEDHEAHEAFYERMQMTRSFEALLEALYVDFLALRLSKTWAKTFVPTARAWAKGEDVDADAYARAKKRLQAARKSA